MPLRKVLFAPLRKLVLPISDPHPLSDIDDGWDVAGPLSNNHGPSEIDSKWQSDMGLSASDVADITSGFRWVASRVYAALLGRGKFAWNQFLNVRRAVILSRFAALSVSLTRKVSPWQTPLSRAKVFRCRWGRARASSCLRTTRPIRTAWW